MIEQLRSSLTQKYSKLLSRRLRCSSTEDHCYIRQKKSVSPFHLRSVKSNQTSFLFSKVKTAEFLKKYPAVVYCFKNFQVIGGKLLWLIKMRLTRWRQRGLFNGDGVKWSCDWQTKVRLCLPCRLISSSMSKFKRPLPELKKKKLGRVKITRGDKGWGRQRTMETLFQFRPQNLQPGNQDGGFSNFGDLPGRLRENQGHYKNTLETGSNFEFKMLTDIYLLSKKKPERFLWHEKYASFSDKRKLTQITT